jgi:hypothetical protein
VQWMVFFALFIGMSYSGIDLLERPIVARSVVDPWAREAWMVAGVAFLGGFVGISQWLLLRRHLKHAGWWGLTIAATYWVGASLTEIASFTGTGLIPSFALSFVLLGPVCGILQWIILRAQVRRAGWWALAQTMSWLVLFAVTEIVAYGSAAIFGGFVDLYLPMSYIIGGAALGALSGVVLIRLLR